MQVSVLEKKEATLPEYEQKRVVREYLSKLLYKNLNDDDFFSPNGEILEVRNQPIFNLNSTYTRLATKEESELYSAVNIIHAEMEKSEK